MLPAQQQLHWLSRVFVQQLGDSYRQNIKIAHLQRLFRHRAVIPTGSPRPGSSTWAASAQDDSKNHCKCDHQCAAAPTIAEFRASLAALTGGAATGAPT